MLTPRAPRPRAGRAGRTRLRLEALEARAVPAVATVTDPTDTDDYDPAHRTDWAGANGQLSLREAIREVNAGAAGDIAFAGPMAIQTTSDLPRITRPWTIAGATDAVGRPAVVLNGGSTTGGGFAGLFLRAGGAVRNLVIQGFGQDALRVDGGAAV